MTSLVTRYNSLMNLFLVDPSLCLLRLWFPLSFSTIGFVVHGVHTYVKWRAQMGSSNTFLSIPWCTVANGHRLTLATAPNATSRSSSVGGSIITLEVATFDLLWAHRLHRGIPPRPRAVIRHGSARLGESKDKGSALKRLEAAWGLQDWIVLSYPTSV